MKPGWIGVDLDGTLAEYDIWRGINHIGAPVPLMINRVKDWLSKGYTVKIVTARVSDDWEDCLEQAAVIKEWCAEHIGQALEITCRKDGAMLELWDDRVVAVEPNTGRQLSPSRRGLDEM